MWQKTTLTQTLGIEYPIIQGPFGGGLSTVALLATVSNAGGMGSFGAHMLSPQQIHALIAEIGSHTQNPYAINLWVSDHDEGGRDLGPDAYQDYLTHFQPWYDELGIEAPAYPEKVSEKFENQIEALLEAAPPVFSFVFGIPDSAILRECRRRNITTMGAATTVEEAVALDQAGVDVVLATGFEAGGHRVSFLKEAEGSLVGSLALIPQVVDQVSAPVVAAGGIADARGVRAALSLGAQAVQIGTAFLACQESGTTELHKQTLFSEDAHQTVLSRAFTGRLARFIPNRLIESVNQSAELPLPFPLQSFFTAPIKKTASEQGKPQLASLYAGQAASLLQHRRAEDLFNSIVDDMNAFFTNLTSR